MQRIRSTAPVQNNCVRNKRNDTLPIRAHNADLVADAIRVHEQFDALRFGRHPTNEYCSRVERCEQLLLTGYKLASEGKGLLKERDARLNSLK